MVSIQMFKCPIWRILDWMIKGDWIITDISIWMYLINRHFFVQGHYETLRAQCVTHNVWMTGISNDPIIPL